MNEVKSGLLVSDFNLANLSSYLNHDSAVPLVCADVAPLGQVGQTLLSDNLPCWSKPLDFVVVWTRPQGIMPSFANLLATGELDEKLWEEADAFISAILSASKRTKLLFIATWVIPTFHQGHGILDLASRAGVARILMRLNLHLVESIEGAANVIPLNGQKWAELGGEKAFNPRLWYSAKVPFSNEVFKAAACDIKAALRGLSGKSRKLVVVDLDDTLWGGTVGEDGWRNLVLGGHDPEGEALVDFQRELKALTFRGILLSIVSKNTETIAMDAIQQHPEMVLRANDFAAVRINWNDKAQNILELARALNLGLDSIVFIDNDPKERSRVREALPEVLVPEWPEDKRLYAQALLRLDCFDKPAVTEEDRLRVSDYANQRQREDQKLAVGSLEEWLKTLGTVVTVERLNPDNVIRAVQLLNKTNQMNLSTRRMTQTEFWDWSREPGSQVWVLRVVDKFGDSGLTGLLSLQHHRPFLQVVDFVLSCRVMGRKVEETMLYVAVEEARRQGIDAIRANHQATARNQPCLEFFEKTGWNRSGEGTFEWISSQDYRLPVSITLEWADRFKKNDNAMVSEQNSMERSHA